MLFGVSDGIQDITRRFGIVRRIRFIYGKSFFVVRKKFGVLTGASRRFWKVRNGPECYGRFWKCPGRPGLTKEVRKVL